MISFMTELTFNSMKCLTLMATSIRREIRVLDTQRNITRTRIWSRWSRLILWERLALSSPHTMFKPSLMPSKSRSLTRLPKSQLSRLPTACSMTGPVPNIPLPTPVSANLAKRTWSSSQTTVAGRREPSRWEICNSTSTIIQMPGKLVHFLTQRLRQLRTSNKPKQILRRQFSEIQAPNGS